MGETVRCTLKKTPRSLVSVPYAKSDRTRRTRPPAKVPEACSPGSPHASSAFPPPDRSPATQVGGPRPMGHGPNAQKMAGGLGCLLNFKLVVGRVPPLVRRDRRPHAHDAHPSVYTAVRGSLVHAPMASTVIDLLDSDDDALPAHAGAWHQNPIVLSDDDEPRGAASSARGLFACNKRLRDEPVSDPGSRTARECPICMDTLGTNGTARALGCVHVYCEGCIRQHIATQLQQDRAPVCPVCKRTIPPEEQRACGLRPHERSLPGFPYTVSVDIFAPDEEPPGPPAAQLAALSAAFPHASSRDLRRNHDPMLLLNRHMSQQRRERSVSVARPSIDGARALTPGDRPAETARGRYSSGARAGGPSRSRRHATSWP